MLDMPQLINVRLRTSYAHETKDTFFHVFYSGPLDSWFNSRLGCLPYRTLDFEWFTTIGDYQGCAVMNYADVDIPWTRIVEHKHFAYWEKHEATTCNREIPRACEKKDTPYYPVRFASSNPVLEAYIKLAGAEKNVTFVGRLGTFCYLDMDMAVAEALRTADCFLRCQAQNMPMPAFMP
jgi:UDP-galactopyranose mutase